MSDEQKHATFSNEASNPIETIFNLFRTRGDAAYIGEPVSQTEHALQAATAAVRDGAASAMVAAALLHDLGHLLHNLPENCADDGIDDRHEELGARWLARYFGPGVVEPLRLHVEAKRFLCATDAVYFRKLSPASLVSLRLQGGPLTAKEINAFRANPHAMAAVALRRWDEEAKLEGLPTPPLEDFRGHLEAALKPSHADGGR
jgi:phosphonate degradation associated HDIG domain protein